MKRCTTGLAAGALLLLFSGPMAAQVTAAAAADRVAPGAVSVRIIAINDLHGHLDPADNTIIVPDPAQPMRTRPLRAGGVAHLATLVRRLRDEQRHSVFVSSGDLIGASPLISGLFSDEPTVEVMNALGLDFNAVGNHEFDHGVAELERIVRGGCRADTAARRSCASGPYAGARFDFLAANVVDRDDQRPLFAPSAVRSFDGVRIGFIGAVTRSTPGIVTPAGVARLRFLDEAAALNAQARALNAAGVETIIASVHEGGDTDGGFNDCANPRGPIFDIVRQLDPAIDIVLSAHTHRGYVCGIDGRVVIQAASFGRLVSVIDLAIDTATGDVIAERTRARNMVVANGRERDQTLRTAHPPLPADAAIEAIVARYRAAAAPIAERPVGRISAPFSRRAGAGGDHVLGRLIADAQLAATRGSGAVVAFTNPGGVRSDLHASGDDGTVTFADAYAVQPFGNRLVTLTLTGRQLKEVLEQQWSASRPERARMLQPSTGFGYTWSARAPVGQRIGAMKLNGRTVQQSEELRVTVNDFLAAGGDGFRTLRLGRDAVRGPLDVEALAAFLQSQSAHGTLAPSSQPRIVRRD